MNPATPVEPYEDLLSEADTLTLMTIYTPGFSGQRFLRSVLPKIRAARELIDRRGLSLWLQVDGGITPETIEQCAEAGADVFTVGNAAFHAEDSVQAITELREKATQAAPCRALMG